MFLTVELLDDLINVLDVPKIPLDDLIIQHNFDDNNNSRCIFVFDDLCT